MSSTDPFARTKRLSPKAVRLLGTRQKGMTQHCKIKVVSENPLLLDPRTAEGGCRNSVVAGAGFEPATCGL